MERPQTYIYEFDDFRVDPGRRLLFGRDGRPLPLTPKAFDTLIYLVQHTDVVLGKENTYEGNLGRHCCRREQLESMYSSGEFFHQ
jgi:DNA-binding response OmpR family regulator